MTCQVLKRAHAPDLAYDWHQGDPLYPILLYLSGYRGDRRGTKASALASHIPTTPYSLLTFDYRGLGDSGGDFAIAKLSDWYQDSLDMLHHIGLMAGGKRTIIAIGSSMGGWLGLRLLIDHPGRVHGFIGLAAAPDFTVAMTRDLTAPQQAQLAATGRVTIPSNTPGYDPYDLSAAFLADGARLALLHQTYPTIQAPITLIHGAKDRIVPASTPDAIAARFPQASTRIMMIDDGDHSLSRPQDLTMLYGAVDQIEHAISGESATDPRGRSRGGDEFPASA
jgi:hypothetical protein